MRNGILKPDEGFDIIVNGVDRDREKLAYTSAHYLKEKHPQAVVEIRVRATGQRIVLLSDGRAA